MHTFTELEFDAFREIMNMGFGSAAVTLSNLIKLHVTLAVPNISILDTQALSGYVQEHLHGVAAYSLVEQRFSGKFSGQGYLIVANTEKDKFPSILAAIGQTAPLEGMAQREVERDLVREMGNILIGACVAEIASLLGDTASFSPPENLPTPLNATLLSQRSGGGQGLSMVFKTVFTFLDEDVEGLLFLVTSEESIAWLKSAIQRYIESLC